MINHPENLVKNANEGVERVKKGGYAFLMESTMCQYQVERNCDLMKIGDLFDSKGYGIGFPRNSPNRNNFSEAILKLQKRQSLEKLYRKWWKTFNITKPCKEKNKKGKMPTPLGVEQIGGVFLMLLFGICIATFSALMEFLYQNKAKVKTILLSFFKLTLS